MRRILCELIVMISLASYSFGQVATGVLPFNSYGGGPFDTVNLGNLNVHFSVPVLHKAGRGIPFAYDLNYDSSIYRPVVSNGTNSWQPVTTIGNIATYWGWQGLGPIFSPYAGYSVTYFTNSCGMHGQNTYQEWQFSNFVYYDASGTGHPGGAGGTYIDSSQCGGYGPPNGPNPAGVNTGLATDGSGYVVNFSVNAGSLSGNIQSRDGTTINAPWFTSPPTGSSPYTATDNNGNKISFNNGTYTDTLGQAVLIATGSAPNPVSFSYIPPANESSGTRVSVNVNFVNYTVQTNFGALDSSGHPITEYRSAVPVALADNVTLPDGRKYTFQYETTPSTPASGACTPLGGTAGCVTGRILKVTLPTGGSITYAYSGGANGIINDGSAAGLTRTFSSPGWTYARSQVSGNHWQTTVTSPTGDNTVLDFMKDGATTNPTSNLYETQRIAYQGSAPTTPLATAITCYNAPIGTTPTPSTCPTAAVSTPILRTTAFSYLPNTSGVEAETDSTFDGFGLIHDVYNYDFGNAAVGSSLRHASTSYFGGMSNGIVDRPYQVKIYDGGGTLDAQTTYNYDESTPATTSGTPQHISITGSRGNLTTVTAQANSSGTTLYRHFTYYDTGMLNTSTGASTSSTTNGPTTTYNYASGTASCGNSFVTSISEPLSLSRSMTWDCTGGVLTKLTDENLNPTTTTYNDAYFWRPVSTQFPDGGQTTTTYNLTQTPPNITTSSKIDASRNLTTQTNFDGLGRTVETQLTSDASGTVVHTDTSYNNVGQVASVTNPYRSTSDPTYGITQFSYDALGRTKSVIQPDNSTAGASYAGNCATVTDEGGKSRESCADGLGRMTQVFEDPTGLNYETDYAYDGLDNLLSVTQKGAASSGSWRTRSFTYDFLSRLITASDPESGTICYGVWSGSNCVNGYDANGNLVKKTDARGITTTMAYDALHRLITKSYSDGTTPSVFFQYDGPNNGFGVPATNLVGRLDEEWTGTSCCGTTAEIFGYDQMGRIVMNEQYTANMSYHPVNYTYDLAGDLTSGSNGEGVTISYSYDAAARPTRVTSSLVDSQHPGTLATVNLYTPSGHPEYKTYGSGLIQIGELNNRLQFCRFNLNTGPLPGSPPQHCGDNLGAPTIQDFYLTYNEGSSDNGNVAMWQGTYGQTFHRYFAYDTLNRVSAMSDGFNNASCRGLNWSYDAWGNRTNQSVTAGSCSTFSASALTNNQLAGYSYDAAGNMTYDGNHHYTYDAENRIVQVDGGSTATYVYDAEGRRAEKNTGGWSDYIHDLGGRPVAQVGVNGWQIGYVYLNGSLLAQYQNSTTYFAHSDHLGSTRLMTAEGPATRIQSSGGTSTWKYYITGVCPTVSGVTYTVSVMVKNQGTAAVQIGGNIVNGPVVAPGVTQQVSFTEAGNGTSCAQLAFVTLHTGDSIDVLAFAPSMTASTAPGTNLIASGNQNFSGWAAYLGSSVTLTQAEPPLVLDSLDYQPYGEQIAGGTGTALKFTGDEHDNESNLEHTLFRQLASAQGRWLTPDPAGLAAADPGNPQSWNRYAYVLNNPLSLVDPLGLDPCDTISGSWQCYDPSIVGGGQTGGCDSACAAGQPDLAGMTGSRGNCAVGTACYAQAKAVYENCVPFNFNCDANGKPLAGPGENIWVNCSRPTVWDDYNCLPPAQTVSGSLAYRIRVDPSIGMNFINCPDSTGDPCAKKWQGANDFVNTAMAVEGAALAGGLGVAELGASSAGDLLFARGTGLLNSNNYFRLGWAWARTSLLDYPYGGLTYFGMRILNWHVNGPIWSYPSK